MNELLVLFSLFFLLLSGLGFYYSSEKQQKKVLKSKLHIFAKHARTCKFIASFLFIIALAILFYIYDLSIGFISVWVFATPIFLSIIFAKNDWTNHKNKSS
jgi:hypothetical protein